MRVAIVGGGVSGLAAAWEIRNQAEVTVFEPGHLGGKVLTEPFEGRAVECGPDAFLIRVPDAVDLCAELGVDDLVAPNAGRTLIWWEGRLRPLPDGLVLGAPKRIRPLLTSGLLSMAGVIRAAADLILPRQALPPDPSVRSLVASRFGAQVADRLVDPLVGSIHAGPTDQLSAVTTTPQLVAAARRRRSLLLGLRDTAAVGDAGPIFLAPRGGLGSLTETLIQRLREAGTRMRRERVCRLVRDGAAWMLDPSGESFDGVILAVGAQEAASLLGPDGPTGLRDIERASVVLVTFGCPELDFPEDVNGVLVPHSSGLLMTACSFASSKWPHWANPGRSVLRVSAGRFGDRRALDLEDGELVERLVAELATVGISATPDNCRVSRWPDSFPQFRVGHNELVQRITEGLRRTHPHVRLCGSNYAGAGLPACIHSGRAAARSLLSGEESDV